MEPRLKIISTYSISPEPHKLKILTATHSPSSLCHNVTVVMPLRQNLQKHNSPPDTLKHTDTPPHGDTDLRCSEPPTSQKASAPFLLFTRSLTGAPRPNSKGFDAASLYHRNRKVTQLKNSQMQGKCHPLSYTTKEAGVVVILKKKKIRHQSNFFEI